MKKILTVLALLAVVAMAASVASAGDEYTIVGVKKCGMCHKAKTGDQLGIWKKSKHAHAYETLKGEEAIAIAKEKGLGNPWEEAECLGCHTTQHFTGAKLAAKSKYVIEEGVSCEACHGPGSAYKSRKIMKDHDAAVANGLVLPDEKFCLKCHNEKSPTFKGFDYKERWAEIAHPVPEKK